MYVLVSLPSLLECSDVRKITSEVFNKFLELAVDFVECFIGFDCCCPESFDILLEILDILRVLHVIDGCPQKIDFFLLGYARHDYWMRTKS